MGIGVRWGYMLDGDIVHHCNVSTTGVCSAG